jgi:glycosyltransferase involved in cell wall biosynthesis
VETWPGYILNKEALVSATHVFTNKQKDLLNLKRIIPPERLTYVAPGIFPGDFVYNDEARTDLRRSWGVGSVPVILSAAMFRSDVKTLGLSILIKACGKLLKASKRFYLVIAGEGRERERLAKLADTHLPGRVRFIGKVPHREMYRFYSAGDLFAFPGINESLGMVYLEAQSCGIPAIAFSNEGTPQAIRHLGTGILVPAFDFDLFTQAVSLLLENNGLRARMGLSAKRYVREQHDLEKNLLIVENVLKTTFSQRI